MAGTNEYITYDIPQMPFEMACNQKISDINTAFDIIMREVEKRRKQLIQNVEQLRQEYLSWRRQNGSFFITVDTANRVV